MSVAAGAGTPGGRDPEVEELERVLRSWVGRKEAARLIGISPEALRYIASTGRVRVVDSPNGKLYHRGDIEAQARERTERRERGELHTGHGGAGDGRRASTRTAEAATWLTRSQAADLAGVSGEWIRKVALAGRIRMEESPYSDGTLYHREDVERIGRLSRERARARAEAEGRPAVPEP